MTAPADPREALAQALEAFMTERMDEPHEMTPAEERLMKAYRAARQDEPPAPEAQASPALRVEDLAKALVVASDPTVYDPFDERGNIPLINARHHAKRIVRALAANPPQTREAEGAGGD